MAVGQGQLSGYNSYFQIGRETVLGTYTTCTATLDFLSASFPVTQEVKILEQIETKRSYSKQIPLSKSVGIEAEFYAYAESASLIYILQNAFGGTVTSATTTGETTGAASVEHTVSFGNMDQSYTSLCFNARKGDSAGGMVFQYNGGRINELSFNAEIDEALKGTASIICFDATKTSNDLSSLVAVNQNQPLSFVSGRLSVETTFAALTTTSMWHIQSFNFGIANNLKADASSRRIGSNILNVLPPGMAEFTLDVELRFDTTTAYDALLANTQFSAECEFTGTTLTGSKFQRSVKFQWPKLIVKEANLPEVSGPDEMLMTKVSFAVMRDDSSAGGYPVRAIVRNLTANYA